MDEHDDRFGGDYAEAVDGWGLKGRCISRVLVFGFWKVNLLFTPDTYLVAGGKTGIQLLKAIMNFPNVRDCPLCFATARYAEKLHGIKHFSCILCKESVLSKEEEIWIRNAPEGHRRYASKMSRQAPENMLFSIRKDPPIDGVSWWHTPNLISRSALS